MVGVGVERGVERDDVGRRQQLVQLHVAQARCLGIGVGPDVVAEQLAAEPGQDPGDHGTDLPGADDARRLAGEIEPEQAVEGEVALPHPGVGAVDPAVERQDQRHRVLGHRMRRVGGHPHHRDAVAVGRRQVDVVVAGAAQRQQAHPGCCEPGDHWLVDGVVDERAHGLEPVGEPSRLGGQVGLEEHQLVPVAVGGGAEELTVVGFRAEDGDAHGSGSVRQGGTASAGGILGP